MVKHDSLKKQLKQLCLKNGATAFGVASVEDVDALPELAIGPTVRLLAGTKLTHTRKMRDILPDAKSMVVFGVPSTDDWCELGVRIGPQDYDWVGYFVPYIIRREVAQKLRDLGYKAAYPYERTAPNSYKRVFRLAGIGAFGKNSLIISPRYGPWLRFGYLLTNAELEPDKPFSKDLCGDCERCLKACPVGALKPYVVDDEKCLVGLHILPRIPSKYRAALAKYEPQLTPMTHVMCTRCQIVCPYTSEQRRKNVIMCRG